ncbi:hypothetical protein [Sphingobacterium faecale]|uniref:Uncharacterized protein n=1 Tax=Sphingobacterium faecale TaxID=2803775 RepID=A0ABS1R8P1_9SPHI|nr:hypothetical protein [Sphingobacterium faecale]MBL1411033.1 hypothetical protein [Sphingobacterium faecale]
MFKKTVYLALTAVLFSCTAKQEKSNRSRYQNQVIEQLEAQGDSVYRVQIGIMASSFWLPTDTKDFSKHLSLLESSLKKRTPLDIGVENGSNKIIDVSEQR